MPIHGTDAAKLKLVDKLVQNNKGVDEIVADVVYSQGPDPREFHPMIAHHEDRLKRDYFNHDSRTYAMHKRYNKNLELDQHAGAKAEM